MADKKGRKLQVSEQVIEDPVSGISVKFVVTAAENPYRILFKLSSDDSWREFLFDRHGKFSGATTRAAALLSKANILRLVK